MQSAQVTLSRPAKYGQTSGGDYLAYLQAHHELNRWPREKLPIKVFHRRRPQRARIQNPVCEHLSRGSREPGPGPRKTGSPFQLVNTLEAGRSQFDFYGQCRRHRSKAGHGADRGLALPQHKPTGRMTAAAMAQSLKSKIQILTHESQSKKSLSR